MIRLLHALLSSKGLLPLVCLTGLAGAATCFAEEAPAPTPTEITSAHFESVSSDKEMRTLFSGDVVVTATNIRMTCERLEIVSLRKGSSKEQLIDKESQFKSLVATGHVRIVQGERIATCGRAEVLPGEDRITLTDDPVVEDKGHDITWRGDELLLLRGERRVQGKHVRVIGPVLKDLSYEKKNQTEQPLIEVPKANP